jgi:hypothetical protein
MLLNKKLGFILIVVTLFLLSVLVRSPLLNKPLSNKHQWLTAHILQTFDIWSQNGISHHFYSPIYTYNNPGDKFISSLGGIGDKAGNFYYISYAPFGFILPYFILNAFQDQPTVLGLQLFNLFIGFWAGIFFLALLLNIGFSKFLALIGILLFWFNPAILWFFGNVYFIDQLSWLLLIILVYCTYRLHFTTNHLNKVKLLICIILLFLCYTEWKGQFFIISYGLFLIITKQLKIFKYWFLTLFAIAAFATLFFVWQYSLINGWPSILEFYKAKYLHRSGILSESKADAGYSIFGIHGYINILNHFKDIHLSLIVILVSLIVFYFKSNFLLKIKNIFVLNKKKLFIIIVLGGTLLIHHLLLFNFTAVHNFSVAFDCIVIIFLILFLLKLALPKVLDNKPLVIGLIIVYCALSSFIFFNKNNFSFTEDHYYKRVGEHIKENSASNQTVFLSHEKNWLPINSPQFSFYAKRNFLGFYNDTLFMNKWCKDHKTELKVITFP